MSDPLSFLVLGSGVAAMTKAGVDAVRAQPNMERTPFGITTAPTGSMQETPFIFDDSFSGPATLWSADRVRTTILARKGIQAPAHEVGNVVLFGLADSGVAFDDNRTADPKVLWSSQRTRDVFRRMNSDQILLDPVANKAGTAAIFSPAGEPKGSAHPISDSSTDPGAVWSAARVAKAFSASSGMKLGPSGVAANSTAVFEQGGQVVASKPLPPTSSQMTASARQIFKNKVFLVEAPAGNLATFNADGSPKDSGALVDAKKTAANIVWPSTRVQKAVVDMSASLATSVDKQTAEAAASQQFSLPALVVPTASAKMALQPNATRGDAVVFDGAGQVVDSKMRLNDAGVSKTDFWSAFKTRQQIESLIASGSATSSAGFNAALSATRKALDKTSAGSTAKMPKLIGSTTTTVAVFDSAGSLRDGGFVLDDSRASTSNVWSSLKISDYLTASDTVLQGNIASLKTAADKLSNLLSGYMNLVPKAQAGNFASFDASATGQLVDSRANATKSADVIIKELEPKARGSGAANMLVSWASPTTLKSSGIALDDSAISRTNVMTAKGAADAVAASLDPWSRVDSAKIYGIWKTENYTEKGPAYLGLNRGNWKAVPMVPVENNFTKLPTRTAFFRSMYFGAVTSPVDGMISVSIQSNKREDAFIPANTVVPLYWNNIGDTMTTTIYVLVDPGPVTILYGYLCAVEL